MKQKPETNLSPPAHLEFNRGHLVDSGEAVVHALHVIFPGHFLAEFEHVLFEEFLGALFLKAAESAQAAHQHTREGKDNEKRQQQHTTDGLG